MRRKRAVRKIEKFSIKKEYEKCFDFLKESRNFIYSAILIFLIFAVIGFFFEDLVNMLFNSVFNIELNERLIDYISRLVEQTEGMSQSQLIRFIFFNNLQSSFFGMIFGVFFGIFSIVAIISNGYILGFVASLSVKLQGVFVLWRIIPHGIFELPAIFISLGLGIMLAYILFIHYEHKWRSILYTIACGYSIGVFLILLFIGYNIFSEVTIGDFLSLGFLPYLSLFVLIASMFFLTIILGKVNGKHFRHQLFNSIKVFLLVVLPLLIVAALIEGTLIALTG